MIVTGNLVCIIDDDASVRTSLRNLMRSANVSAVAYESAEAFLQSGSLTNAKCIITDIQMPGMSGIDLKTVLNAKHVLTPVIMITARTDEGLRMRALAVGAFYFFSKPFETESLMEQIALAIQQGSV